MDATAQQGLDSTSNPTSSDKVWTTLITNLDYLPGLLTLAHSLRRSASAYPLVALYTPSFPACGLAALAARNIPALPIPYLLPRVSPSYANDPRFHDCWSKLAPFSLTQFARVVQLDSDMLVLRNVDELMELELDDEETVRRSDAQADAAAKNSAAAKDGAAAAAKDGGGDAAKDAAKNDGDGGGDAATAAAKNDTSNLDASPATQPLSRRVFAAGHACVCNPLKKPHYPSNWTPANCAFTAQHASPSTAQSIAPACTAGLGYMNGGLQVVNPSRYVYDQILAHMQSSNALDMDFADQSLLSDLYRARWVPLPYVYNALKTMRRRGVHDAIWRDDCVKNVHYILGVKPWHEIDGQGNWTGDEESHAWWVDMDRHRKANERALGIPDDGF